MRWSLLSLSVAGSLLLVTCPVFAEGETGTIDPTDAVEPASSFLPSSDTASTLRQEMNLEAQRSSGKQAVRGVVVSALSGHLSHGDMSGIALKYTDVSRPGHDYDLSLSTWKTRLDGYGDNNLYYTGGSETGIAFGGRTTLVPLDSRGRQIAVTGYAGHTKWATDYQLLLAMEQRLAPSLSFTGNMGIFTTGVDWSDAHAHYVTAVAVSYRFRRAALGIEYQRVGDDVDDGSFMASAKVKVGQMGIAKFGRTDDGVYSLSFGQQFDLSSIAIHAPKR